MMVFSVPPGYRRSRPPARPKLDPFIGIIDQILEEDKQPSGEAAAHVEADLRASARRARLCRRANDREGLRARAPRQRQREVFVPLRHDPPGHAQVDFGEALAVIGGVDQKIHFFAMDLPHSRRQLRAGLSGGDDGGVSAPAMCAAFDFFGGVPLSILYDNTKIAVARILGDGTRQRTRVFSELQSHYLFADRFGRPGKGNDKGKVEGLVGYDPAELPGADAAWYASFEALNARSAWPLCRRRLSDGCAVMARRSANGWRVTWPSSWAFPRRRYEPARRSRPGSARFAWCAIAAPTTRCRPPRPPRGRWSAATSTRW